MSGYTKGTWRSVYLPGSKQRCAAVESPSEGVYIYLNVAKSDDMDATIERWKNDAQLISSAPELLEALKLLLEDSRFQVSVGGNPSAVEAMLANCRSAIAKAEGR
jgi:hypothetical protein